MRHARNDQRLIPARHTAQADRVMFTVPSRRGFISGLAALIAAPALVRASSIMPAKAWVEPAVTADPTPISDDMADLYRWIWDNMDRCLVGHQSPLLSEGRLPEVSAWKSTAGPGGLSAPDGALFPARSPAVVQVNRGALPSREGR